MDSFCTADNTFIISNNGQTVTRNDKSGGKDYRNAYGSVGINSNTKHKYTWKLTINKRTITMMVGIASHKNINVTYDKIDYSFDNDGYKRNLSKDEKYGTSWNTWNTGD
eukprot:301806_1